jgi:hypothetical protein
MTGSPAAPKRSKPAANATNESPPSGPFRDPVPMKPRKGLFVILMLVLAAWCGVMVVMYFRTIRSAPPLLPRPPATAPALAQGP